MDRKERLSELGQLKIKDLKKKYIWRSLLVLMISLCIVTAVYLF